jgi:hypothetical protein
MKLIDIAKQMAVNIGEETPDSVQGTDPFSRMAVQFINETGKDMVRRVDWHVLSKTWAVTGDGTDRAYSLAPDHDRLVRGLAVSVDGNPVRGSLSQDELASVVMSEGLPRYFWATSSTIRFYPFPAAATVANVFYQSKEWAVATTEVGLSTMSKDSDVSLLSGDLLMRGAVARWLRHAGKDFSDQMAEYEAMLTDYAGHEGGMRQP